jgi:trypsin
MEGAMLTIWLAGAMSAAHAQDDSLQAWDDLDEFGESLRDLLEENGVVGGTQAAPGTWDDAAGIVFNSQYVGCTGVLIHENLVLTAGHCASGISHVLLGSTDWYQDEGSFHEVRRTYKYGDVYDGIDIALLILEENVPYEPRMLVTDCIRDQYLKDGAEVSVVGYGNTRANGNGSTSKLNEGITFITDHDCSSDRIAGIYTGCNPQVSPGGELAAGGNGVDACFGDSGGPLYLLTEQGDFLAGITSRALAGAPSNEPCYYGGIYGRPDYIIDWIENRADVTLARPQCNAAPEPTAVSIVTARNTAGETRIAANDPDGEDGSFTFEVVEPPRNGSVKINDSGLVTYTPDDGYTGKDSLTVSVTDGGSPDYEASGPISADVDIKVTVEGVGGCSSAPRAPLGWLALLAVPLLVARRRRML